MDIYVTGSDGNVGSELIRNGCKPLKSNITHEREISEEIALQNPDVIIHCAAITDVDYCEDNVENAVKANVTGVNNVISAFDGTFIYLSTDHVFGRGLWLGGQYSETREPNPINMYGMTKFAGEEISKAGACKSIIVRTSKLFDYRMMERDIRTIREGKKRLEFTTLIYRSFLYLPHFVEALLQVVERKDEFSHGEVINIAGKDTMNYYQFWYLTCEVFGIDKYLVRARNYKIDASPRPFRGGLEIRKAMKMGLSVYSAKEGLEAMKNG